MSSSQNKWLVFLVVATGVFMSTLDSSMVNIALPIIMQDFHSSLPITEWVVLIYLLTITATLLFWGHLSDRLGRGRVYSCGMLVFGAASLVCAYSPGLVWLICFRFCQALGAAMMMSTGPAIIKETFPPEQLGRTLGLVGVAVSLGLMTGPAVGGYLIEFYGWRSLFMITVPVGFLFAILGSKVLPRVIHQSGVRVDWFGSLTWALALTLACLALTHATSASWSFLVLVVVLGASVLFLGLFIRIELLVRQPLLPLDLFRERFFSMGVLSAVLSFAMLFSVIMLIPFYLDRIINLPPSRIGLVMMAVPSSIMLVAPFAGWLSDHTSPRLLPTSGLMISSLGLLLLSHLTPTMSLVRIAGNLAILGVGQAMFLSPNSSAVLASSGRQRAGVTAALLATARNMGMLLGAAQAALVFSLLFSRMTGGLDMKHFTPEHTGAFVTALHGAFGVASVIGLVGVLASWFRGKMGNKELIVKN
ncbi:MAG: MFS transporter [Proteobacteria bacterium]|nr:MFS transporter [Pseudomonadota bacterium]MBU1716631.1 MFS transporter [Pseudomonadota bacterium]